MLDPQLAGAIGEVLRVDPGSITPETTQAGTAAWDSMAHLNLIMRIEDLYGVHFAGDEIPSLTSVQALQEALRRRGVR